MSEDFFELLHGLLIPVLRAHVDLCEDDEEGDLEEKAESDVLLRHFLETHVGPDHHTAEVRREAGEPVDGGLEVLFVAAQIDHRDYLIAVIDDLLPVFVLVLIEPFRKNLLPFFSEPQNFLPD